ncbi:MAG TPA: transposase, partial [Streptosporangiaceae bacterium]
MRSLGAGPALIMAHQIDLFCVPQLADTECLEADHNGGTARGRPGASTTLRVQCQGADQHCTDNASACNDGLGREDQVGSVPSPADMSHVASTYLIAANEDGLRMPPPGPQWPGALSGYAHHAFAATADPLLEQAPAPVAHLGIDEHRRGKPRWTRDPVSGEYELLADRWHFFDLSGRQGLLGQVEGRTADDAAYWLAQAIPAWRDAVRVVAIDMCNIYLSAVRRMLPHAAVAVDLFHLVQLAVKTVGDVRRRAVRGKYGRRGRSGDPEYGIKNLLTRNLEHLTAAQFAKIVDTLDTDAAGQQIAAWIAKEKLRDVLNLRTRVTGSTPCERNVRDRLYAFCDWCAQHEDIPELISLAKTIARWEDQITCAVLTGVTNATSESLNRLAKLEARQAYGFRNPANQRRRV